MEFWRISNYPDLSGAGGVRSSGRWHTKGKPVVYLADHPASAVLELLVRMDPDLIPDTYTLLRVVIPDDLPITTVELKDLPSGWHDNHLVTQQIGDQWLDQAATPLLQVPSAIVPAGRNLLLNPAHSGVKEIQVVEAIRAPFDPRLIVPPKRRS